MSTRPSRSRCRTRNPRPRFAFSPTWMDVESGGDRQVLARRWLVNRGGDPHRRSARAGDGLDGRPDPARGCRGLQAGSRRGRERPVGDDPGGTAAARRRASPGPASHEVELSLEAPPAGGLLPRAAERQLHPRAAGRVRHQALGLAGEHRLDPRRGREGRRARSRPPSDATPTSQSGATGEGLDEATARP